MRLAVSFRGGCDVQPASRGLGWPWGPWPPRPRRPAFDALPGTTWTGRLNPGVATSVRPQTPDVFPGWESPVSMVFESGDYGGSLRTKYLSTPGNSLFIARATKGKPRSGSVDLCRSLHHCPPLGRQREVLRFSSETAEREKLRDRPSSPDHQWQGGEHHQQQGLRRAVTARRRRSSERPLEP